MSVLGYVMGKARNIESECLFFKDFTYLFLERWEGRKRG